MHGANERLVEIKSELLVQKGFWSFPLVSSKATLDLNHSPGNSKDVHLLPIRALQDYRQAIIRFSIRSQVVGLLLSQRYKSENCSLGHN